MKLTGKHEFSASAAEVYRRLLDPDRLRSCMPGCERFDALGDDRFSLTFGVPIPAIKGTFDGTVEIVDQVPPESFRMKIDAKGKNGFVTADVAMRIESTGPQSSIVHYDADAQIGGAAASVGQRVITGISRRQVADMMKCLDKAEVMARRPGALARLWAWIRSRFGGGPAPA